MESLSSYAPVPLLHSSHSQKLLLILNLHLTNWSLLYAQISSAEFHTRKCCNTTISGRFCFHMGKGKCISPFVGEFS